MSLVASEITSLTIVSVAVYSGTDQGKHQSSASLAFVRGIHGWQVNSPHKWPVTRKMFPFDDIIMLMLSSIQTHCLLNWFYCNQTGYHFGYFEITHFSIICGYSPFESDPNPYPRKSDSAVIICLFCIHDYGKLTLANLNWQWHTTP